GRLPEEIRESVEVMRPKTRSLHGAKFSLAYFPLPWVFSHCADKFGYMSSAAIRTATSQQAERDRAPEDRAPGPIVVGGRISRYHCAHTSSPSRPPSTPHHSGGCRPPSSSDSHASRTAGPGTNPARLDDVRDRSVP